MHHYAGLLVGIDLLVVILLNDFYSFSVQPFFHWFISWKMCLSFCVPRCRNLLCCVVSRPLLYASSMLAMKASKSIKSINKYNSWCNECSYCYGPPCKKPLVEAYSAYPVTRNDSQSQLKITQILWLLYFLATGTLRVFEVLSTLYRCLENFQRTVNHVIMKKFNSLLS